MNPLLPALLGGALALAGTTLGAFLTYWLNSRVRKEQRAYEESIRKREHEVAQRERFLSVLDSTARRAVTGGVLINAPTPADVIPAIQEPPVLRPPTERRAGCVPKGTFVVMADKTMRLIESIMKGDLVAAYDAATKSDVESAVVDIITAEVDQLVVINHTIALTPQQQIFCDGSYIAARLIRLGQKLMTDERELLEVESVERDSSPTHVYSLRLQRDLGYFVKSPSAPAPVPIRDALSKIAY